MVRLQSPVSPEKIRASLSRFNRDARGHWDRAAKLIVQTRYWIFDPDSGTFGPTKFVANVGMDFDGYEQANSGQKVGDRHHGSRTKRAAEDVLGRPFAESQILSTRLERWATGLLGGNVLDGVNREKWRFLELPVSRSTPSA